MKPSNHSNSKTDNPQLQQDCGQLVSPSKQTLSEKDLLMLTIDNPRYLSMTLGHDSATEGGTGLITL